MIVESNNEEINVIDLFYNEILKEAEKGRVDCGFIFNIVFSSSILKDGKYQKLTEAENKNELLIPHLKIKNKELFDLYLQKYFVLARDFYKDQYYCDMDCEKAILANVWANAIGEDFLNPINFLRKRIAFLEDNTFEKYYKPTNIGHCNILDSDIIVHMQRDGFLQETPYFLEIIIQNGENKYVLPEVKLAFYNNEAYIYGLQRDTKKIEHTPYTKKINRLLYKVNKNFLLDNKKEISNLKDITPSALLSLNIAVSLLKEAGIEKIKAPIFLPMRWNAKKVSFDNQANYLKSRGIFFKETALEFQDEQLRIQKNMSDKFMTTFRRLEYHNEGVEIAAYPTEIDEHLHVELNNQFNINNPLLYETSALANNQRILSLRKEH